MNKDKQDEFMGKLVDLFNEYNAEIIAEDHYQGYAECGSDIRMTIDFGDWEIGEIDLGKYWSAVVYTKRGKA